jgi:2-polyprenyl-3-methyl-5-hydroxy-6-metoxy-1,4-benzoquinol methylase
MNADLEHLLNSVISELKVEPLDLLGIGDETGESAYLEHSRCSYLRTLKDVMQVADTLPLERNQIRILEVGAFLGVISCVLARLGFDVTALDIPEFMDNERLNRRYHHDGVTALSVNLRDYTIPCESASYTLVIMCETLEHLNFNPLPVMTEINRITNAGGYLYLSLPNLASLVNRLRLFTGDSIHNPINDFVEQLSRKSNMIVGIHWREYTVSELRELVELAGFSIINHYLFTTHKASLPARLVYALVPRMRSNQTVLARKVSAVNPSFHFCQATR